MNKEQERLTSTLTYGTHSNREIYQLLTREEIVSAQLLGYSVSTPYDPNERAGYSWSIGAFGWHSSPVTRQEKPNGCQPTVCLDDPFKECVW